MAEVRDTLDKARAAGLESILYILSTPIIKPGRKIDAQFTSLL